jgi:hypothetical protein
MKAIILALAFAIFSAAAQTPTPQSLAQERRARVAQLESTKSDMFLYILDHKLATASIIATGGGLAGFLQENMDSDTRTVVMLVGLVGLAYCVDSMANARECATVTAELGSYAAKINAHQAAIARVDRLAASITAPQRLPIPQAVTPPQPQQAPQIRGSDVQGPAFHAVAPEGIYVFGNDDVQLTLGIIPGVSKTIAKFDLPNLKAKAEEVSSKLHSSDNIFRFVLLERDTLLILKHTTLLRNYGKPLDARPAAGINYAKQTQQWARATFVHQGSPAAIAGLMRDDWLVSINGRDTRDLSLDQVTEAMAGGVGTRLEVVFLRPSDSGKLYTATITKTNYLFPSEETKLGYVAILRDANGKYFYFRNDKDDFYDLPLGKKESLTWKFSDRSVSIDFVRPNTNSDPQDREVNYLFAVR